MVCLKHFFKTIHGISGISERELPLVARAGFATNSRASELDAEELEDLITSSLHSWGNRSPVRTSNLSVFLSGWWLMQNQYPGLLSPDQELFLSILEVDRIPSLVWFLPPQASLPAASGWSRWRGSSRFGWELFSSTWQLFPAELSLWGNYPFLRDDLEALSLTADTGLAPKTRTLSISLETAITVTRRRLLLV